MATRAKSRALLENMLIEVGDEVHEINKTEAEIKEWSCSGLNYDRCRRKDLKNSLQRDRGRGFYISDAR